MVDASVKRMTLFESRIFDLNWPIQFQDNQKAKTEFANSEQGWMLATTVGGQGLGRHPDFFVIDDPHKAADIDSLASRQAVRRWWNNTAKTRGRMRKSKRITIMQRLHRDDFSATQLSEGATHVCLPMVYDPARKAKPTPLGEVEWRTQKGQLLIPESIDEAAFRKMTIAMTPQQIDTIYNQIPPDHDAGAEWPGEWFNLDEIGFDEWPNEEDIQCSVIALDPSLGKTARSDFQAFTIAKLAKSGAIYVDASMERQDISTLCDSWVNHFCVYRPNLLVCEGNGFQEALEPLLQEKVRNKGILLPLRLYTNSIDKRTRISAGLTGYLKMRMIYFRRGSDGVRELLSQMKNFPDPQAHDDGPDSLEMAVRALRELWAGASHQEHEGISEQDS